MFQLDALPATTAIEVASAYAIARFTGSDDPRALAAAIDTAIAYGCSTSDASRLAHDTRNRFNYRLSNAKYELAEISRKLDRMVDDNYSYDQAVASGRYATTLPYNVSDDPTA